MRVCKALVTSAIVALAIYLPVAFSTFSSTGALTLTLPTFTAGTTALTTTQVAALAGGLGLAAAAGLGALVLASSLGGSNSDEGTSSYSSHSHSSSGYSRKSRKLNQRNQKTKPIDWKRNLNAYGRGKREVPAFQLDFEDVFQKISKMDVNDCAKRYVCEISATPTSLLSEQDVSTLSMFGQNMPRSKTTSAKHEYDMAWARGTTSGNFEKCKEIYKKCPVNGIAKFVSGIKHV